MGYKGKKVQIIWYIDGPQRTSYYKKQVSVDIQSDVIRYQFLKEQCFFGETVMFHLQDNGKKKRIQRNSQFPLFKLPKGENSKGIMNIYLRSLVEEIKDQLNAKIQDLKNEIQELKKNIGLNESRQQFDLYAKKSIQTSKRLQLGLSKSNYPMNLDLGIMYSQPLFDINKQSLHAPVGFRPQIKRLENVLESSWASEITLRKDRTTLINLKTMIKQMKPKILHISCHGRQNGQLQFEHDQIDLIGYLRLVNASDIKGYLEDCKDYLPTVVFLNTCYSQIMGKVFLDLGVKYVITINSQNTIKDSAALDFSQNFYKAIFRGENPMTAFKYAKMAVSKHPDNYICCCYHQDQYHKPNCKWKNLIKPENENAHALYHIPSSQCKCEQKRSNKHEINCTWAKNTLFAINQDFVYKDPQSNKSIIPKIRWQIKPQFITNNKLTVCCCLEQGKNLHDDQCQKFKCLTHQVQHQPIIAIQNTRSHKPNITDYSFSYLLQVNQRLPRSIIGRAKQFKNLFKIFHDYPDQNVIVILGDSGSGRTVFAIKVASYLKQRKYRSGCFYVNLSGVRDQTVFIYKFNLATKLRFNGDQLQQSLKGQIIIVLDNCDDYITSSSCQQFYKLINSLRRCTHGKLKILLIMRQQTYIMNPILQSDMSYQKFELPPLDQTYIRDLLYAKIKDRLNPTVQRFDVGILLLKNGNIRYPKDIQIIYQALSNKDKITQNDLKDKIQMINGNGQFSSHDLIKKNLQQLKKLSKGAYDFLLFISQFSDGVSLEDIIMMKSDNQQISNLKIPISQCWFNDLQILAKGINYKKNNNLIIQQDIKLFKIQQTNIKLQNQDQNQSDMIKSCQQLFLNKQISQLSYKQLPQPIKLNAQSKLMTKISFLDKIDNQLKIPIDQSSFLSQMDQNKIMVKSYLKEYIWHKFTDTTINQMKYLFISYICVMLQSIFNFLKQKYIIHEDVSFEQSISCAGVFSYSTNLKSFYKRMCPSGLTTSGYTAIDYQNQLQKLINKSQYIKNKIIQSKAQTFIKSHIQDFSNIYNLNFKIIFQYLKDKQNSSHKIFMCFFQNLLVQIPISLRIIKADISLQRYFISKSQTLFKELKKQHQQSRGPLQLQYLILYYKLCMIKAKSQLENKFPNRNNIQDIFKILLKQFPKEGKEGSQAREYIKLRNILQLDKRYILIMFEHRTNKDYRSILAKVQQYYQQNVKQSQENTYQTILSSKIKLLICQMYLGFIKGIQYDPTSSKYQRTKYQADTQFNKTITNSLKQCQIEFQQNKLWKLLLKSKITRLQLIWQLQKDTNNQNQYNQIFINQCKQIIIYCNQLLKNYQYKLGINIQFKQKIFLLSQNINQKFKKNNNHQSIIMDQGPFYSYKDQIKSNGYQFGRKITSSSMMIKPPIFETYLEQTPKKEQQDQNQNCLQKIE